MEYVIEYPEYVEDEELIIEAKGIFDDLTIVVGERRMRPTFYDPVRLAQDFQGGFGESGYEAIGAHIVVPAVTRENIELSVDGRSKGMGFSAY